ncbi:hypothetical protein CGMCC3_g9892 [Colletotrichum fructicola]|nr:uncharacterized protein CGMCC3_g9892 [Colletotrichum fructicola]KAE9574086.1 hypothetical protein CGMCC3_g9892 [Colletotrichum fructicola]
MRGVSLLCGFDWISSQKRRKVSLKRKQSSKTCLVASVLQQDRTNRVNFDLSVEPTARRLSSVTRYTRRTSSLSSYLREKSSNISLRRNTSEDDEKVMMNPLRAQLRTAQIPQETAFTGSFVPYSSLKELISKQVVKDTLTKRKQKPRTDISTLVSFVCGKPEARRIFAILVWIGQVGLIDTVYAHNFVDSLLPLYIDHNGTVKTHTTGSGASEIVTKVFSDERWTEESPDFFCEAQWQFLGPIFREQQFKYSFLKQHRMPFLKQPSTSNHRESYFSTVEKWCIHKAHFKKSSKIPISLDRNGHPLVAVKSLKSVNMNDQEYRDAAETEADVLEMIRDLEHPHLIKAIAYYTRDDQYYIVFPWAGGGNLRDYWGGEPPRELDAEYIGWVVGQLCGLAGAMERLHSSSKGTCRHGDLKPENILCFEDRGRADPFAQPFLVIADVGLAKVHTLATEMRNEATRTKNGTVMYEPPEAILQLEKNQPRSRRYDTWSMGCIYFEFLIWVLYGKSELVRFGEDITHRENRSRQFFEVVGSGAVGAAKIKPSVQKWVDWMRKDPRCPRNTAVREILELICTRLLVIEVQEGCRGDDLRDEDTDLAVADDNAFSNKDYVCSPELTQKSTILANHLSGADVCRLTISFGSAFNDSYCSDRRTPRSHLTTNGSAAQIVLQLESFSRTLTCSRTAWTTDCSAVQFARKVVARCTAGNATASNCRRSIPYRDIVDMDPRL